MSNEKKALQELTALLIEHNLHTSFDIKESGLIISTSIPFLAASPDGIFNCPCHGKGVIEIKCPWKHRNSHIDVAAALDDDFCLKLDTSVGNYYLPKTHSYYYQVQLQMFLAKASFCLFVVYTTRETEYVVVHYDAALIETCVPVAAKSWKVNVLPECLSKFYTVPRSTSDSSSTDKYLPCYCQQNETIVETVLCSDPKCMRKKFHVKCIELKNIPNSWTCTYCKRSAAKDKRAAAKEKRSALRDITNKT